MKTDTPERAPTTVAPDPIRRRIAAMDQRVAGLRAAGNYHYFQPVSGLDGAWVQTPDGDKLMFATYNYLGLLGHPRIGAAAQAAIDTYGTGSHGVRIFGGTLDLHQRLERRIAGFCGREDAIVFSSGYITNVATISSLVGRGDWVISDRLNHASIVDGCQIALARFQRFPHNDMDALGEILARAPAGAGKLVVADAVFSMDGDIFDLPRAVALCRRHRALLMVDEAHSLGVLGPGGRGIEAHFGMPGSIHIRMGTLSKVIPSVGGYCAGERALISYLRHVARGFVFSAALPPPAAAAALAAFDVIESEGEERIARLDANVERFLSGLRAAGFDTGPTVTPIVPIMVGDEERALAMTRYCQERRMFVLPVLPPAVPVGSARLRVNVTAEHTAGDIDLALEVLIAAGREAGVIGSAP